MRTLLTAIGLTALVGAAPAFAQPPNLPAPSLPAPSLPAPSLMQRLERYCIATQGDDEAAIRLARQDGFVAPPAQLLESMPREMRDMAALWIAYDGGVAFLMTGQMTDRRSPMKGEVCAVASMPQSQSALGDLERWLGAKLGREPFALFIEAEDGSRRVLPRSEEVAAREAMRRGKLHAAGAMSRDQMSMLILVKVSQ